MYALSGPLGVAGVVLGVLLGRQLILLGSMVETRRYLRGAEHAPKGQQPSDAIMEYEETATLEQRSR